MQIIHKQTFANAYKLLNSLRKDRGDLSTLRTLQQLIFSEILVSEQRIRSLKSREKILLSQTEIIYDDRIKQINETVEKVRQCAYVCRCFGDSIAFSYMDKYALKHTYFSTEDTSVKKDAGFLSGKEGLNYELAFLEEALDNSVPAILADLTNIIRHGDVCLLGGPDPYPIEVKASSNIGRRGRRQRKSIQKLYDFFKTDRAENFRGLPEVKRRLVKTPEKNYWKEFNECVENARTHGHALCHPENGVYYVVTCDVDKDVGDLLSKCNFGRIWVFSLNELKNNRSWAPYEPFLLLFSREDDVWDFIQGTVHVTVLVDMDELCDIAVKMGHRAIIDPEELNYPFSIKIDGVGELKISAQMLGRIAMECVSPEWIVAENIASFKSLMEEVQELEGDHH